MISTAVIAVTIMYFTYKFSKKDFRDSAFACIMAALMALAVAFVLGPLALGSIYSAVVDAPESTETVEIVAVLDESVVVKTADGEVVEVSETYVSLSNDSEARLTTVEKQNELFFFDSAYVKYHLSIPTK